MKNRYEIDMSKGKLFSKIVSFAVPLIVSGILQLAFNAADLIVVGRFSGENSLAAVGSNSALVSLVINVLRSFVINSAVILLLPMIFGKDSVWYTFGVFEAVCAAIAASERSLVDSRFRARESRSSFLRSCPPCQASSSSWVITSWSP